MYNETHINNCNEEHEYYFSKESIMSIDGRIEYDNAKRKGVKDFNSHKFNGERPYVPVLDTMISKATILSEVQLGNMEIPIKKIKGTKTAGRATSFAPNYMPILNANTEFGTKWAHLCNAHLKEGIRDPIKVYEYLNWYYVEEGNKRVSVLKYHEAVMISANVTRLIPRYDENDNTIVLYYEFLEFYKKTRINYLWMSKQGSFNKLLSQIKKYKWLDDENEGELSAFYYRFRRQFYNLGYDSINITTGDALLAYLEIYSYCSDCTTSELKRQISNLKKEFVLLSEEEQVALSTDIEDLSKKSFFDGFNILNSSMKSAKIAFVNSKDPEASVWTYGHEIGRNHLNNIFGDQIVTKAFNNTPEDDSAYDKLVEVVKEGYNIVFTTTPTLINATVKAAIEFKDVKFLNCSENQSYKKVRTYFGRIYEPNFLVGMIAGAMTKTNNLGYVVTYPIPEVISSINAFTLGARFVNPFATVQVKWVSNYAGDYADEAYDIDQQLKDMGVDIISHQESQDLTTRLKNSGIYMIDELDERPKYLATPVWNWGEFYEEIVKNIMSGSYNRLSNVIGQGERAINFWWGIDTEVVDVFYSKSLLPREMIQTVEYMKEMIIKGQYHPFRGPIYDQDGRCILEEGNNLSPEQILTMDWFVEGVLGRIPMIDANELNHPLLELASVNKRYK